MTRRNRSSRGVERRGIALLIVVAMLALFAVVGLSFVFYAEMEADIAKFRRQAETIVDITDPLDTEKLAAFGLGQLIFGADPEKHPGSRMRGHSLAESMYGIPGGTVPFNGIGRPRPDTTTPLDELTPFEGINVPYTYPDINNPFLATADGTGRLLSRSFFRNGKSLRPATLPLADNNRPNEGDVRNFDTCSGIQGNFANDAFWMDLGHPVVMGKDGTRFKPLFAFTVLDLDGRVNLNVAGNPNADYVGPGTTSRCGLGPFEINPAKVLAQDPSEIKKLFAGHATPRSRYGPNAGDGPDVDVVFPPTQPYSRVDYSGISPSTMSAPTMPYSILPTFGAWADAVARHPAGFDPIHARGGAGAADAIFPISNVEGLVRWRDRGAPNATNDLFRLLEKNLVGPPATGMNPAVNLITPFSMSLDTAHLAPLLSLDPARKYQMAATDNYPKSTKIAQPLVGGVGDITATFASRTAGELRRINLNRGFADDQDRVRMAREIFDRLVRVTGATPPTNAPPFQPANIADPEYRATRWLAQLAVNIVDFIDDDDNMTAFNWNPKPNPAASEKADFVFGVEMPRLLINEVFVSYDNDKIAEPSVEDPMMPRGDLYRVNAWAELFNPMSAACSNGGKATLAVGNQPRYRLLLADFKAPASFPNEIVGDPEGLPSTLMYEDPADPSQGVVDWGMSKTFVPPGDGNAKGPGFFIVGPNEETLIADRKPTWGGVAVDHASPGMSSKLHNRATTPISPARRATLVLQRLADASRGEQPDPTKPGYNPFVTVDYFSSINIRDNRKYDGTTLRTAPIANFQTFGRRQPLQAGNTLQNPDPPPPANGQEPKHTFGRHNAKKEGAPNPADTADLISPFVGFYHLDRPLVSTAELLMVPGVPPWLVTQRFPGQKSGANELPPHHCYPAFRDVNSLLARFLETVTVGDRMHDKHLAQANGGVVAGAGRHRVLVPGKINLNTVVDKAVVQALFDALATDAQGKTLFAEADISGDVNSFWADLKNVTDSRAIAGFADYTLDRTTNTATSFNTLLAGGRLFDRLHELAFQRFQASNPNLSRNERVFEQTEAIRKVMNNITFTSNAFAVWLTVGFFEVDANDRPIREIGAGENRQTRRRAFAVVDRSQLVVPDILLTTVASPVSRGGNSAALAAVSGNAPPSPQGAKVDFPTWKLRPGMAVTIDRDLPTEETVVIDRIVGNAIEVAAFAQNHAPGATVHLGGIRGPQVPLNKGGQAFILGHPGPQPNFNPRDYSYVVPHINIID